MFLAQAAFTHLPALNWLFHTAALGGEEWPLTVCAGFAIYPRVGYEKSMRRMRVESRRLKARTRGP